MNLSLLTLMGRRKSRATTQHLILWLLPLLLMAAVPAQAVLQGTLTAATCGAITGWAWDSAKPTTRLQVQVYDVTATTRTLLTTLTANTLVNSLLAQGKGDGKYGFSFIPPNSFRNNAVHKISVRFSGTTTELTGSPMSTPSACYGQLNDTGWQYCSNTANGLGCPLTLYPRQDAEYGRDKLASAGQLLKFGTGHAGFDYTKVANNGTDLPSTAPLGSAANAWACTRDNVTGLLWEVRTNDGGLRDTLNTYTYYNPNPATNGGSVGIPDGGSCTGNINCDSYSYINAVNALKLCGKSSWRLPTIEELIDLEDYTNSKGPDPTYFLNTQAYWTISSTVSPGDYIPSAPRVWIFYSTYGFVDDDFGYYVGNAQIRLVSN